MQVFNDLLGIREIEDGLGVALDVRAVHLNRLGYVHGGVTSTLVDAAFGVACRREWGASVRVVTVELSVHYLRPGKGTRLEARYAIEHAGRRIMHVRGQVTNEEGVVVASGSGVLYRLASDTAARAAE